jgi:hypothetical protein
LQCLQFGGGLRRLNREAEKAAFTRQLGPLQKEPPFGEGRKRSEEIEPAGLIPVPNTNGLRVAEVGVDRRLKAPR